MAGPGKEKSIRWMVGSLVLLVAFFGWGFLAGSYADAHAVVSDDSDAAKEVLHLRRGTGALSAVVMLFSSVIVFLVNAITQLPNLPWVIGWHFTHRVWLPLLIIMLEAAVISGGYGLQRLEENLAQPPGKAKKRRRKGRRQPTEEATSARKKKPPKQSTLGDGYGDFDVLD